MYNDKLHNLYSSSIIISAIKTKEDEMGGVMSCSTHEMRNANKILVRKPEGKDTIW